MDDVTQYWIDKCGAMEAELDAVRAANFDYMDHFNQIKADYDRLRKQIDEAYTCKVYESATNDKRGHITCLAARLVGKRVALVVLPEVADK